MKVIRITLIVIGIIIYLSGVLIALLYSIKYPDNFVNIFSLVNGLLVNISAIELGVIAIYQAQKYKLDSEKREMTPVLMLTSVLVDKNTCDIDVIYKSPNKEADKDIQLQICSFNKSVSNFVINSLIVKKGKEIIHDIREWESAAGVNSCYMGIFLQDKFYYISFFCPAPLEGRKLEVVFTFNNIYSAKYSKKAVFLSQNNKWELERTYESKLIK